jgi:hypothetical protein
VGNDLNRDELVKHSAARLAAGMEAGSAEHQYPPLPGRSSCCGVVDPPPSVLVPALTVITPFMHKSLWLPTGQYHS